MTAVGVSLLSKTGLGENLCKTALAGRLFKKQRDGLAQAYAGLGEGVPSARNIQFRRIGNVGGALLPNLRGEANPARARDAM